jgi:hypothetical protein
MRSPIVFFFALVLGFEATAQSTADIETVKKDIQKLYADWNQARLARDRQALEKLFTDDYAWVHGVGYLDDKATAINDQLSTDSINAVPVPDLSRLEVYGDAAILKRLSKTPQGPSYSTTIFVRQNGRWMFSQGQTTLFQPERKTIQLSAEALLPYAGKYQRGGRFLVVTRENDVLNVRFARAPVRKLVCVAENNFVDKLGSQYKFAKDEKGNTTSLAFTLPGSAEVYWRKVE